MTDNTTTMTLSSSFPNNNKPMRSAPQPSASLIDRLPTELRLQIYDLLFPDRPVPAHPCDKGALRADGAACSTKILRLNRAIHAEAQAILYSKVPFQIKVHPGGIALCGGGQLTYPDFDFGKRGGPRKIHAVADGAWDAVLANARRVDIVVVAWVQYNIFDLVKGYARHLADRLAAADPPLLDVRLAIEWHNGTTNFPVTHPTPAMARQLLEPFEKLRVRRCVDVGNVATPRYFFGAPALAVVEEEEYKALKEELRDRMLVR